MRTPPDGENAWRSHLPTAPANENSRLSRPVIRVIALLALSALINYIDRGNLSIAAPLLKDELGLSASQLGILLSSFFWTYSLFLPVSGWLRSEEHTSELQSQSNLVCRLLLEKKKNKHSN